MAQTGRTEEARITNPAHFRYTRLSQIPAGETSFLSMKRYRAVSSGLAGLALVLAPLPGRMLWADALKPQTNTVLIDAMDAELHRALSSLGTSGDASQQMKPYFLSYAVSDSDSFTMTAQYGAISATNQSRRRIADVQLR